MYSFKSKHDEYHRLATTVFPVQQQRHFSEHPEYSKLTHLLNLCNEVQSLIVTFHPGHNRYQQELHYIGESLEFTKKRALSSGSGVIHRIIPVHTHDGWTQKEYALLDEAKTIEDAYEIALRVIRNQCGGIKCMTQVCGPISTGGYGNVEKNLVAFHYTIQKVKEKEIVFDQMPFEPLFHRIHAQWVKDHGDAYMNDILDKFYLPLFEKGHIKKFAFMYGYGNSYGARWEHDQAVRLKREIQYLSENYVDMTRVLEAA